jgi:hypothetical protein
VTNFEEYAAASMAPVYIPIAIVTTVNESYIVLAVLLGAFLNKES